MSRKARSGDFTAGNFLDLDNGLRTPSGQPVAKLYWIPTVGDVAKVKALTLTIVAADGSGGPGSTQSFGGNGDWAKTADGRYFWPTQVIFHAPGDWRVTASAPGLVDGCFLVTVA